ncbi:putative transcription regulator LUG family [Lupinus albus]|uniref:Putative transcription regulator LUG family n=1 Tax=Lupinus albus TaxID=3870 RepID=A0A6A4P0P5_LUPAL|nr:putative transcription regulator LUG family [Lupinus albus]
MASNSDDLSEWDADKLLRIYLHEYMLKRGMHRSAEIFKEEGQIGHKDSTVIDSPKGFLYEWWSIFYGDVYSSWTVKDQENVPEPSYKMTDNARNGNSFPMIPQIPMSQQRPLPHQFQASSSFNSMPAQLAAGLIPSTPYHKEHLEHLVGNGEPSLQDTFKAINLKFSAESSSNHSLLDVGKQTQNQIFKDSGIGIRLVKDVSRDPLQLLQPKTSEAVNLAPLNRWPRNNQVLTSLVHEPNYSHQCQVLKTQNPRSVPAQTLESAPASQTFTVPAYSTKYSSQYLNTPSPKTESNNKDKQVCDSSPVV